MKNRRRSKAIKWEFPLPESMIQHIQSFLGVKEAAQTSIVSKSWHSAWSTRPNLEFNERDFGRKVDVFWEFMEKTMQRYVESNHKIESFRLVLLSRRYQSEEKSMKMVEELIVKAMKIGTVNFNFVNEWIPITLPCEVLGSITLTTLSVSGCKIDLVKERKVGCFGLKSLNFENVEMECCTLWDIVSSCPYIENFNIVPLHAGPPLGSFVSGPVNLYQLYKLKSLLLFCVDLDSSFFCNMSSKFPLLKDLIIGCCYGYKGIELSSHSLECISFTHYACHGNLLWAKCDVPNIRKFKLVGENLPSLSCKTASREWESDINLWCDRGSAEWFIELNKFLDCLSLSKISLTLRFSSFDERDVDFQGLRKCAVENLYIVLYYDITYCVCLRIIKYLFQSCRPKFINQYWLPLLGGSEFLKILYKTLVQAARGSRSSVVAQDLEEVNVEVFKESVAKWRPLAWITLLRETKMTKARLQLRWRPEISDSGYADMR